jgi:hypothetical protein
VSQVLRAAWIFAPVALFDAPAAVAQVNGSFPNVAVYLNEQSAQLPGRNLDVYADARRALCERQSVLQSYHREPHADARAAL